MLPSLKRNIKPYSIMEGDVSLALKWVNRYLHAIFLPAHSFSQHCHAFLKIVSSHSLKNVIRIHFDRS